MENQIDPCRYFADIEANPYAITPRVTLRQWFTLQEHIYNCDTCYNRMERVWARAPKERFPQQGAN